MASTDKGSGDVDGGETPEVSVVSSASIPPMEMHIDTNENDIVIDDIGHLGTLATEPLLNPLVPLEDHVKSESLSTNCDKTVQIAFEDAKSNPTTSLTICTPVGAVPTMAECESCVRLDKGPRYKRYEPRCSTSLKKRCMCKDYWGIMLSIASGLASTFGGIIVRHMKEFHPFSLATYRFQGILLPTLVMLLFFKFVRKEDVLKSIWPMTDREKLKKLGFTIVRAVIGCLGLYLYFYAIKLIPLADAKVILSCRPVFVIFVARIFLGEPCGIFPVFISMLAILGVGVISRPPILTGQGSFDGDTLVGYICI